MRIQRFSGSVAGFVPDGEMDEVRGPMDQCAAQIKDIPLLGVVYMGKGWKPAKPEFAQDQADIYYAHFAKGRDTKITLVRQEGQTMADFWGQITQAAFKLRADYDREHPLSKVLSQAGHSLKGLIEMITPASFKRSADNEQYGPKINS